MGVAISGGADSTALLLRLQDLGSYVLSAIHVNHGWRGTESDKDAAFCAALAARLRIPFHLQTLTTPVEGNLEAAGREARLQFFRKLIETNQIDYVVTAHTRNDQAETVLLRLLRGSALKGLAGIHPVMGRIVRPMLDVTRDAIVAYLQDRNEVWREDASNADVRFRRNRIRHELLPQLERDWNPELTRALAHTAQLAWDEEQFWKSYTAPIAHRVFQFRGNTATADASILMSHPVAVARRLVRWMLERIKGDARQIEHQHVESVLRLATLEGGGHGRVILPGVDVMRSFEWLRFAVYEPGRDRVAERNVEVQLTIPGEAIAPDGSRIHLEVLQTSQRTPVENENDTVETAYLPCSAVMRGQVVTLRNWRPGDRYRPMGHMSVEKLKVMFQESRVPLWDRATWPIITKDAQILWARKFGPVAVVNHIEEMPGAPSSQLVEVLDQVLRITRFE